MIRSMDTTVHSRSSMVEHDDEDEEPINDELPPDDENHLDQSEEHHDHNQETTTEDDRGNAPKEFTCHLCSISFSKFEGYREHFVSTEHRYKRRDEKKRLGVSNHRTPCFRYLLRSIIYLKDAAFIETTPVEVFVNLLLYNKVDPHPVLYYSLTILFRFHLKVFTSMCNQ